MPDQTTTTTDGTPPNVKIFDRPEPKRPSPILLTILLLIALATGFFGYRTFFMHPTQAPSAPTSQTSHSFPPSGSPAYTLTDATDTRRKATLILS